MSDLSVTELLNRLELTGLKIGQGLAEWNRTDLAKKAKKEGPV